MPPELRREALRKVQAGLDALGHGPGPLDGFWGPRTRGAVERLLAADGEPAAHLVTPRPSTTRLIRQGAAAHPVREIILHCSATRPD